MLLKRKVCSCDLRGLISTIFDNLKEKLISLFNSQLYHTMVVMLLVFINLGTELLM